MFRKRFLQRSLSRTAFPAAPLVFLAGFLLQAGAGVWSNAQPRKIETAAGLVKLGNEAARAGLPVHLKGQVTFVDAPWGILFLQDGTGAIFVNVKPNAGPFNPGDLLDVRGISAPGAVAPIVVNPRLWLIRAGKLPRPEQIDAASLQAGAADSRYVQTSGILRPGPDVWDHTSLVLVDGATSIPVMFPGGKNTAIESLIGARVLVRGVNSAHLDSLNRRLGSNILVSRAADIVPVDPAWKGAAEIAFLPLSRLRAPEPSQRFLPAVHLKGFVAWKSANDLLLSDGAAAAYVQSPVELNVKKGDQVDVIGFPEAQDNNLAIRDALVYATGAQQGSLPPLTNMTAQRVLQSGRDGDWARIQGRIISEENRKTEFVLTASDGGTVFTIRLPLSHSSDQLMRLAPGSMIQCDGVLRVFKSPGGGNRSFELLVDSPSDIQVNTAHTPWKILVSGLFLAIVCGILLWIVQLNRALRSTTIQIRKQLENEVQLETRYRRLFERNLAAVFSWRPSGEITDCNQAFARLLGFNTTAEVVGQSYWSFCVDRPDAATAYAGEAGENGCETALRRADGRIIHVLEQVSRVGAAENTFYETTALDVTQAREHRTELKRARDAAQREAERDALTGLPNRRKFAQLLEEAAAKSTASGVPVALLYLDLDGFKIVNDTLGHSTGDLLLRTVGERLRARMDYGNTLFRIGGDEFAILVARKEDARAPERLADSVLRVFQSAFEIGGHHLAVGASIGISAFPAPAASATLLMQQADAAMYVAKRSGKNQASTYCDEIGIALSEKNLILTELKKAVDRQEIELHYQPQFDARTAELLRFEALARWSNRHLGYVPPQKFIAIAEECGFLRELGGYLLERACRDAVRWCCETGHEVPVAVNVSTLQLRSPSFAAELFAVLKKTGLRPDLLELEMTESVMVDDPRRMSLLLAQLRSAGITLALDDFGTGYSCLDYLSELKFDRLKVSPSFLRKADLNSGSAALMSAVVNVAHALDTKVVVEGIETAKELQFVKRLGADEVQGFLLGRPSADVTSVIRKHHRTDAAQVRGAVPQPALIARKSEA